MHHHAPSLSSASPSSAIEQQQQQQQQQRRQKSINLDALSFNKGSAAAAAVSSLSSPKEKQSTNKDTVRSLECLFKINLLLLLL
jgi:hypothetical protein